MSWPLILFILAMVLFLVLFACALCAASRTPEVPSPYMLDEGACRHLREQGLSEEEIEELLGEENYVPPYECDSQTKLDL